MGIDWEYLLGTGGENLERAYNDAIPEPDSYPCDESLYEDDEFNGEVNDGEECEAYEPEDEETFAEEEADEAEPEETDADDADPEN